MKRRHFLGLTLGAVSTSTALPALAQTNEARIPYEQYGRSVSKAPFGGEVSPAISYYNRVSPYIANAGLLLDGGVAEARRLGFKLIVDLRAPDEDGVTEEIELAQSVGIKYVNIPVTARAPGWDQVEEFASIIHQSKHYPVLVHCVSANRSGAIWAMYRAHVGVPALIAIDEGRAAGLESREKAVRKQLNID